MKICMKCGKKKSKIHRCLYQPGLKEVPARKIEIPSLKIPPNATKEEVAEMTQKFMEELKEKNIFPIIEPTSTQEKDQN